MPDENLLINELLREYLAFNHLARRQMPQVHCRLRALMRAAQSSTLSVLNAETGASAMPLDRSELATLVGVVDDEQSIQLCVGSLRCAAFAACADAGRRAQAAAV